MESHYLVVKGSGGAGIGDKLRAVVVAIIYAKISNRTLCIDWKDTAYGDGSVSTFPQLFALKDIPTVEAITNDYDVFPSAWANRLDMSFDMLRAADGAKLDGSDWNRSEAIARYSFDLGRIDYPHRVLVMWDFDQFTKLYPYLEQIGYGGLGEKTIQSLIARKHIRLKESLQIEADRFVTQNFGQKTLGVHVRRTNESEAKRIMPTLRQYISKTRELLGTLPKDSRIFLASDNAAVIREFNREFGTARLRHLDKWMPEKGESIHKNRVCPDPVRAAKDAVLDAYLLSKCDRIILLTNSSFSYLSCLWTELRDGEITYLAPRQSISTRIRRKFVSIAKVLC